MYQDRAVLLGVEERIGLSMTAEHRTSVYI